MNEKKDLNLDIPAGYVATDPDDDFRALGMSEEAIKELDEEIKREIDSLGDELTPEQKRLLEIIDDPNATFEEQEAARRKLNPEMYDEDGNLVLDDSDFFDRTEANMKRLYEEMKARGDAI